jgi:hypothetical protein
MFELNGASVKQKASGPPYETNRRKNKNIRSQAVLAVLPYPQGSRANKLFSTTQRKAFTKQSSGAEPKPQTIESFPFP